MDMLDHLNVINDSELKAIVGGASISGTLIRAYGSAINVIMNVGRSFGTAIRRVISRNLCLLK